jgi:hypothetical protein
LSLDLQQFKAADRSDQAENDVLDALFSERFGGLTAVWAPHHVQMIAFPREKAIVISDEALSSQPLLLTKPDQLYLSITSSLESELFTRRGT